MEETENLPSHIEKRKLLEEAFGQFMFESPYGYEPRLDFDVMASTVVVNKADCYPSGQVIRIIVPLPQKVSDERF